MSGNKIETIHDTVLKVRLVFFDIVHELPYEGPCRFGKGMELERQFDEMINNEAYKGVTRDPGGTFYIIDISYAD